MANVNVAQIEPGMVLADDLKDQNGRFLLAKGVELSDKHLKIMKTWGVVEADIEGVTEQEMGEKQAADIDPKILEKAEEIEKQRFILSDLKHEAVHHLFQICVLRRAKKMSINPDLMKSDPFETATAPEESAVSENSKGPKYDPKKIIRNRIKLPSLPTIFHQINEAINDPKCSATHIANIISKDQSLSARLLQLVNSAFYNFPSKIETITRAVAIIGTKQLSTLSLGTCALAVFKDVPSDLIDMKSFWEHSIACGIIARILASYKNNTLTERFFVGGLLHDIGRLILFMSIPEISKETLLKAKETGCMLHQAENDIIGFDHSKMGGILLKEWKLPMSLENIVRFHHIKTESQIQLDTAVVHIADIMANALEIGNSGEHNVPPLVPKAWAEIGLSTGIITATVDQAKHHIDETMQILFRN
ncbi:MAG TPA: HDOD domain-containing protein [Deltaproteobacteria bacterium]|nr:HDOD domain-containing protein [Deltaproteobacteria bacterium]